MDLARPLLDDELMPSKRQPPTRAAPERKRAERVGGAAPNRAARRHSEEWLNNRLACSPGEAATALGLSRDAVYALLNKGTIRSVKVGTRRLVPTSELRRLLGETEASA